MSKKDIDNLIGLNIESAIDFCNFHDYKVEFYPEEAILPCSIKTKTLKFWHKEGIIKAWTIGNIWELGESNENNLEPTG